MYHKFYFEVIIFVFIILCVSNSKPQNCDTKPCVSKCCSANSYVYDYECVSNSTLAKDFSDANVYNSNLTRVGSLRDKFQMIYGNFKPIIPNVPSLSFYILENGSLEVIQQENSVSEVKQISNDNFCVDYKLASGTFSLIYGVQFEEEPKKNITFSVTGLIISSIFLLLVLIIYALLEELRNLKGKILMANMLSLLCAFVILAMLKIVYDDDTFQPSIEFCYGFTTANYFFFLSSFFWMNLTSFDIWWTLRSMTTRRVIRRHGKRSKFKIYCIYGWGLPLAMSISLILIDVVPETPDSIIKPNILLNGCFLEGKPKLFYLDIPMLLVILSNWICFLMTAYNYWCCEKDTKVLNSNNSKKHDKHKQSFKVYIKLSLIMGISWITEIISAYVPNLSIWYITDAYNMLIGVAIFYVFVCKPDILKKLSKRFQRHPPAKIPQDTIQSSSV